MNTAVRTLANNFITPKWLVRSLLSRSQWIVGSLLMVVMLSGLSVIYIANANREMTATLESLQIEAQTFAMGYDQLLLEQAAWSTQARVHDVAGAQLMMSAPAQIIMVN